MGVAQIQAGDYGDAMERFTRAHRLEPERPEALVNFGYLADLRGDWKRAVAYYVQAIASIPYVPESYVNLGIDYEHNGLYSLAQSALLKGVAAAPYDGRIHYLLARAYARRGRRRWRSSSSRRPRLTRPRRRADRQRRVGAADRAYRRYHSKGLKRARYSRFRCGRRAVARRPRRSSAPACSRRSIARRPR